MPGYTRSTRLVAGLLSTFLIVMAVTVTRAQQPSPQPQFGGGYAELGERRQTLVNDWVARLVKTTGQKIEPGPFYDDIMSLSTRITFEAVTHALQRIQLTDASNASLGDALALIDQIELVKGEVTGAAGDRQFRMYVRLTPAARETLARTRPFKRGADNTVFHKGYPTNYREQGVPSVQISIALDGRRADIDVDYRASSFPSALFNGHLTSANSDVRAGNNYDRHISRWTGFQKWWGGFFGTRPTLAQSPEASRPPPIPTTPRLGKKNIDAMVNDFLTAWLVEGDIVASMGYVSERSYACLARNSDNPAAFDYGLAPVQLMIAMKAVRDGFGPRASLDTVVTGLRLTTMPALRVVTQPHHAKFVIYSVPDDVAASFDCESQVTLGDPKQVKRAYGNYFGATFLVDGRRNEPVALLWAMEQGFWKIVSWKVGADDATTAAPEPVAGGAIARISADSTLVQAAWGFLDSWLVKKNYDAAFAYLSPKAYACYDLERDPANPASTSPEDAGRKLRSGLEAVGTVAGAARSLEAILSAPEPLHPAVRVMNHQFSDTFSLGSMPNALADAGECGARAAGNPMPETVPLEYGAGFSMNIRFNTRSGDAAVMRMLWRKENNAWRITSYAVETP